MPVSSASFSYGGASAIARHSQIANMFASPDIRRTANDLTCWKSHYANMDDTDDKNGGPNHLRAWMIYRKVNGQKLAKELGGNVTPGMVSDLANSKRAMSAKWLRRIAPILETTPGMLLDHDPELVDQDLMEFWNQGNERQRRQLVDIARAVVRDETAKAG